MVEHAVIVLYTGGRDARIHFIGHAGHLREAGELVRHAVNAPLQHIQDLLAGDLDHGEGIAEGLYSQQIAHGNIACFDGGADAAAVDDDNIRSAGLAQICVRHEVRHVGFRTAHDPDRGAVFILGFGIHDGQVNRGFSDNFGSNFADFLIDGFNRVFCDILQPQQFRSGEAGSPGIQFGGYLAVGGDGQGTDKSQLGAAGGAHDVLSVLVLHRYLLDIVAVAVQHCGDSCGVGNHIRVRKGLALVLVSQVGEKNDVVNPFRGHVIHGFLHSGVKLLTGFVSQEVAVELAFVVPEVLRVGGPERFRGGYTDKADLSAADFLDQIGREDLDPVPKKIAADIGEIGLGDQFQQVVHAVVEVMVAGNGHVVAHGIHDGQDRFPGCQRSGSFPLIVVPVVHQ